MGTTEPSTPGEVTPLLEGHDLYVTGDPAAIDLVLTDLLGRTPLIDAGPRRG